MGIRINTALIHGFKVTKAQAKKISFLNISEVYVTYIENLMALVNKNNREYPYKRGAAMGNRNSQT